MFTQVLWVSRLLRFIFELVFEQQNISLVSSFSLSIFFLQFGSEVLRFTLFALSSLPKRWKFRSIYAPLCFRRYVMVSLLS